jgi:hypothetical protein
MKAGKLGAQKNKLSEIPQRLKKFISHDVRKNPILGLYLVIGVMVVGYAIYFAVVMYMDFTSGADKRVASKPKAEQVQKAPVAKTEETPTEQATAPAPPEETPEQPAPAPPEPETETVVKKVKPAGAAKLDLSKWRNFKFPDGSHISIPPDWNRSEVPAENSILHGLYLKAPGTEASLKCYSRSRRLEDNYAQSLKETMQRAGYNKIKQETKHVNQRQVVQLSGLLLDKHMLVSVFDDQPDRYFIVRLIASKKDYAKLRPYYSGIVDSFRASGQAPASAVSIEKIEQQLEKSIEKNKDYLVGSTIWIKLKSGARHQGVVIAEDDTSITLESFRFGGKYSFTVKKKDIAQLAR